MANYYVKSSSTGGALDGSSWANAYTGLGSALAARSAGDTFWVSSGHNELINGNLSLTSPGAATGWCNILCVNDTTEPPNTLTTGAIIATSGTSRTIDFNGFAYNYGMFYRVGTSNTCSIRAISTNPFYWTFENCGLQLNSNSIAATFIFGSTNAASDDGGIELINSHFVFGAQQRIFNHCPFSWCDSISGVRGTIPNALFSPDFGAMGVVNVRAVDFSSMSGKSLVEAFQPSPNLYTFTNCKLGDGMILTTGNFLGQGGVKVTAINCDSGNTNYKKEEKFYQGTIITETGVRRTNGATDGATVISKKMVASTGISFTSPLESAPIIFWNNDLSSRTITVPILTDGITLTDGDAWVKVEYLGNSSYPLSSFITDRKTNILSSNTNQTLDTTSVWNGTGTFSNPVKQELSVTFTPALKGIISTQVVLARTGVTMYFDPLVMAGGRQYQSNQDFINEPTTGSAAAIATNGRITNVSRIVYN